MVIYECATCAILKPILRRVHPRIFSGNPSLSTLEWSRLAELPAEKRTPEEELQMADLLLSLSRDELCFSALVYTKHLDGLLAKVMQLQLSVEKQLWLEIGHAAKLVLREDEFELLEWPRPQFEVPV
jgi:hypothetical protein